MVPGEGDNRNKGRMCGVGRVLTCWGTVPLGDSSEHPRSRLSNSTCPLAHFDPAPPPQVPVSARLPAPVPGETFSPAENGAIGGATLVTGRLGGDGANTGPLFRILPRIITPN